MEPLFKLDSLTLQAFIFPCPDRELKSLFAQIPPHVAIAWMSYLITNLHQNRLRSTNDVSLHILGNCEFVLQD